MAVPQRYDRGYDHVFLLVANAITVALLSFLILSGQLFLTLPLAFLLFTAYQSWSSSVFRSGFRRIRYAWSPRIRIVVHADILELLTDGRSGFEPFYTKLAEIAPDAAHVEMGSVDVGEFKATIWFRTNAEAVAFRLQHCDDSIVGFPEER